MKNVFRDISVSVVAGLLVLGLYGWWAVDRTSSGLEVTTDWVEIHQGAISETEGRLSLLWTGLEGEGEDEVSWAWAPALGGIYRIELTNVSDKVIRDVEVVVDEAVHMLSFEHQSRLTEPRVRLSTGRLIEFASISPSDKIVVHVFSGFLPRFPEEAISVLVKGEKVSVGLSFLERRSPLGVASFILRYPFIEFLIFGFGITYLWSFALWAYRLFTKGADSNEQVEAVSKEKLTVIEVDSEESRFPDGEGES